MRASAQSCASVHSACRPNECSAGAARVLAAGTQEKPWLRRPLGADIPLACPAAEPNLAPAGGHEAGMHWQGVLPTCLEMRGGVPLLTPAGVAASASGVHGAEALAVRPSGAAPGAADAYLAQPGSTPRRAVQSWGMYGSERAAAAGRQEQGGGGAPAHFGARGPPAGGEPSGHASEGPTVSARSSLDSLACMATQPAGRAPMPAAPGAPREVATRYSATAPDFIRPLPLRGGLAAALPALGGGAGGAGAAPAGHLVPDGWGLPAASCAAFMDVVEEDGLAGGFPDLPGIANERQLAAMLGLPAPVPALALAGASPPPCALAEQQVRQQCNHMAARLPQCGLQAWGVPWLPCACRDGARCSSVGGLQRAQSCRCMPLGACVSEQKAACAAAGQVRTAVICQGLGVGPVAASACAARSARPPPGRPHAEAEGGARAPRAGGCGAGEQRGPAQRGQLERGVRGRGARAPVRLGVGLGGHWRARRGPRARQGGGARLAG